jgi:hypothetical protein
LLTQLAFYDHWLGGKDNYAVDRSAAEALCISRRSVTRRRE